VHQKTAEMLLSSLAVFLLNRDSHFVTIHAESTIWMCNLVYTGSRQRWIPDFYQLSGVFILYLCTLCSPYSPDIWPI